MKKTKQILYKASAFLVLAASMVPALLGATADAASLSAVTVRFDRMATGQPTTGTVCAKPSTIASTETTVQVTFPAGYTLGVFGKFTVNTTNLAWPSGAVAWPSIATATSVAGQVVTFPSGDLTAASVYCFNWNDPTAVTVSGSATASNSGSVATYASGPTLIDSGNYSTASVASDQIAVTASIPQSFSLSLSGTTDALGALSSGSVASSPTPRTVTINTNAAGGWNVWARDSNTGLASASASKTIASTTPGTNSTLAAGTEGYNTGVTSANGGGVGTITVATPFVGGATGKGGGLNTSFAVLAGSNGTATNHVLTLTNNAASAGATAAATDYSDTITVVGAASF